MSKTLFKLSVLFLITTSCSFSEYDTLLKTELKKNQKVDSVFFNLRLGESKEIYHKKKLGFEQQQTGSTGAILFLHEKNFFRFKN